MDRKDYVSIEVAEIIRKNGYKIPANTYYINDHELVIVDDLSIIQRSTPAPRLYDVQKWLRNVYNINIMVGGSASGFWWEIHKNNGTYIADYNYSGPNDAGKWDNYEDALDSCILSILNSKLLKNIKKNK